MKKNIRSINLVQSDGMVKYKDLGFKNFNAYVEEFFDTLLPSNKTYEYFVNWNKVKNSLYKYLNELSLINSLTRLGRNERKYHLKKLLKEYPSVVEIIPMLIAERAKRNKIDIYDPELDDFINFDFRQSQVTEETTPKLIEFCDKTGTIDLFGEIKDINDYLLGVEVGLDSNARKNRSGSIFENMVQQRIKKLLGPKYKVVDNDPAYSLYPQISKGRGKGKTHDNVVYKDERPILIVECNFYNVSGSKPISIAESYPNMFRAAKQHNIEFLWVTDGPAWYKMRESLLRAMNEIDWIFNFKMIRNIGLIF